jgi:hypothetical protein
LDAPQELAPMSYTPNGTLDRLRWIAERYRKRPVVAWDTVRVALSTQGLDRFLRSHVHESRPVLTKGRVEWVMRVHRMEHDRPITAAAVEAVLTELSDELSRPSESDIILPWVAVQIGQHQKGLERAASDLYHLVRTTSLPSSEVSNKRETVRAWEAWYEDAVQQLINKGPVITQWATAENIDLTQYSLEEVLTAVFDFEGELQAGRGFPQGEVVFAFDDGWAMQELTTDDQLTAEGAVMQNCVGDYCAQVAEGGSAIYSLRDPQGRPHATLEFGVGQDMFLQVKGKQNELPKEEYLVRLRQFARRFGDPTRHGQAASLVFLIGGAPGLALSGVPMEELFDETPPGVDLRKAKLKNANLEGFRLERADMRGADLEEAQLNDAEMFWADLRQANLRGALLMGAKLREADLRAADLVNAELAGAELIDANLSGADLRGAILLEADLSGADLRNALVTDANFDDVDLDGAHLPRDFDDVSGTPLEWHGDWRDVDWRRGGGRP